MNFSGTRSNNISPPQPIGSIGSAPATAAAAGPTHAIPTRALLSSTKNNVTSTRGQMYLSGITAASTGGGGGAFAVAGQQNPTLAYKYVYDLPFFDRKEFCRVFDENNQWETLGGGLMGYSNSELSEFGRAIFRGASPTDCLLTAWGSQNHTILELFTLCGKLYHYRGMRILGKFVDPKYHNFIKDPNINVTAELVQAAEPPSICVLPGEIKIQNTSPEKPNLNENENKQLNVNDEIRTKLNESVGLLPHIPFEELNISTEKWDRRNILGKGGFGTVFKGVWKNTQVAIKRMENRATPIHTQRKQSLEELKFLNSYRHDNILPLYGYCMEGDHPLCLVYQYMPNGSLEDRLLCRQKTPPLNWSTRFSITRGVACGIQFLHSIGPKPLIHGDIKSANILLDRNFEAKVGDFGLARQMNVSEQIGTGSAAASYVKVSRVHGTRPYLPDEYLRSKKLSTKVDTFSFGIMLLEIITGQRAYEESRPKKFLKDLFDEVESSNVEVMKDPRAGLDNPDIFWIFVRTAKSCIARLAKERPDMVQVLKSLDGLMSQATSFRTVSSPVTGIPLLFETRPASLMPTTGISITHRLSPVEMRTPSPHMTPGSSTHQQQYQYLPQYIPNNNKNPILDSIASVRRSPIPSSMSTQSTNPPYNIIPTPVSQQHPTSQIGTPPTQPKHLSNINQMVSAASSNNGNGNGNGNHQIPLQSINLFHAAGAPKNIVASASTSQHQHPIPTIQKRNIMDEQFDSDDGIPTTITQGLKQQPLLPIIINQPATASRIDQSSQSPSPTFSPKNTRTKAPQFPNHNPLSDDFFPLVIPSTIIKDNNEAAAVVQQESSDADEPKTVIPLITELGLKDD